MNRLVTVFMSKEIEYILRHPQVVNENIVSSVPLYGYHKKGECGHGETTVPQHILIITGTRAAGASSGLQSCTCSSQYQQLGEITSTSTRTQSPSSNAGLQAPQPNLNTWDQQKIWIKVDRSVAGCLSSVFIDKTPVDLGSVCLILYSPSDICQSDLLSLKYPYHYKTGSTDVQPVPFCIAKVRKQFQSQIQTKETSKYVLYQFLKSVAFMYQKVLSIPNLCMGLQSHLHRLFGYKSATLHQVSLRTEQLSEIQLLLIKFLDRYSRSVDNFSRSDQKNARSVSIQQVSNESCASQCSQSHTDTSNTEATQSKTCSRSCPCATTLGESSPDTDTRKSKEEEPSNRRNFNSSACLVLGRLVCVVFVDLALGALLLHWLLSVVSVDGLFAKFGETTQGVSDGVLRLLSWLRGAPAGLKLNQPLARALATFFSYHVGLWMLYLEVASGAVYGLCCGLVWSGVLGASVQVALLADMLHLATLHLHCIYVYAARIHMVQVSLLGSQWRAFRGHKWNPLKQRVDSLHPPPPVVLSIPNSEQQTGTSPRVSGHGYNTRQSQRNREQRQGDTCHTHQDFGRPEGVESASAIRSRLRPGGTLPAESTPVCSTSTVLPEGFVTTSSTKPLSRVLSAVIFTMVVFLLPTTTVFYLVFVSLRLVLFLVRTVLASLAWLLHHNPLYLVLLTLGRSSKLKGDIYFERLHVEGGGTDGSSGPLLLSLSVRPSGLLTSLRQYAASDVLPSLVVPDVGHLLQTILFARHLL